MRNSETTERTIRNGLVTFALMMTICCFGEEKRSGFITQKSESISAVADSIEYDTQKGYLSLTGEARVDWGDMRLTADHVTVQSATDGDVHHIEATGNVKVTSATSSATGGKAHYDHKQEMITLTIRPELTQANHRITDGDRVTYNLKNGRFKAINARLIIDPQSLKIGKQEDKDQK